MNEHTQGLIEQIVRDNQTLEFEPIPWPRELFYIQRIADYEETLWREKMEEMNNENNELSDEEVLANIESNTHMTEEERLYAKLFFHETTLVVRDMDFLTLKAHIEELSKIAKEAACRYHAAKAEHDRRKKKDPNAKSVGFERSLNVDETSIAAINTIKERQTKLSKRDKILANLVALYELGGMSHAEAIKEAESKMTAGTILGRLKDKASQDIITGKNEPKSSEQEPSKPFINPFEKKQQ